MSVVFDDTIPAVFVVANILAEDFFCFGMFLKIFFAISNRVYLKHYLKAKERESSRNQ
jgi:hypothetical protein